jgi:hypothetical protein
MEEHFAELFGRYEALAPQPVLQPAVRLDRAVGDAVVDLALAPSAALGS